MAKELDFRLEARNAQRLAACMAGRRRVAIPEPVPQVSPSALVPSQTSALHSPAELAVSEEQLSHLTVFPVASMGFGLSHPFESSEGHFWCMGTSAEMLACQQCQQGAAVEAHRLHAAQLSGERIITMEWMDGCKLTDLERLRDLHLHSRDVAIELLQAFAQMTFVDGFGRWWLPACVQCFSNALTDSLMCALILRMRWISCYVPQ